MVRLSGSAAHRIAAQIAPALDPARIREARLLTLHDASGSVGGILAWYSLIHHEPSTVRAALEEFARVIRVGGSLLLGFFIGPAVEPFDHAVVTAYRWSPEALSTELRAAGFDIIETHTRIGRTPKPRPHGAIVAQLALPN